MRARVSTDTPLKFVPTCPPRAPLPLFLELPARDVFVCFLAGASIYFYFRSREEVVHPGDTVRRFNCPRPLHCGVSCGPAL